MSEIEPDERHAELPDFRSWSRAAVRLLQDVVYFSDEGVWSEVLASQNVLRDYFARVGLTLVVDETNGFAYLRQFDSDAEGVPVEYAELPKLYRRSRLGYGASLVCVLLREELRRFDSEEVDSEFCVVEEEALFDQWKAFFPVRTDEQAQYREFSKALYSARDAGFTRQITKEPAAWEVRRIIKAKLDAQTLEQLKRDLAAHVENAGASGN
jgi:hypothetical protein